MSKVAFLPFLDVKIVNDEYKWREVSQMSDIDIEFEAAYIKKILDIKRRFNVKDKTAA